MRKATTLGESWGVIAGGVVDHPKFAALAADPELSPLERLAAVGLWAKANAYTARHGTDGAIARHLLPLLTGLPPAKATRLADGLVRARKASSPAGLWEASDVGYQVHDYTVWNYSRAEREGLSHRKAEAGRRGGRRSAQARGQASAQAHAGASDEAESKQVLKPVTVQYRTTSPISPPGSASADASTGGNGAQAYHPELWNTDCPEMRWRLQQCVSSAYLAEHPDASHPVVPVKFGDPSQGFQPKQCPHHRASA